MKQSNASVPQANPCVCAASCCPAPLTCCTLPSSLQGVLTPAGCQLLARVSFLVFTPALTFSKLTQAVSLESIQHLWPLLLNMTVGCAPLPWLPGCNDAQCALPSQQNAC